MRGDFPSKFHAIGWIHSTDKMWWGRMVGFSFAEFENLCCRQDYTGLLGLPSMVFRRATNISTLSWSDNPETCTLFTPIGEIGLALHEMYEVSGLIIGDAPYEEYVPSTEELHLLKKSDPLVYETYWEVLCHFHICGQVT